MLHDFRHNATPLRDAVDRLATTTASLQTSGASLHEDPRFKCYQRLAGPVRRFANCVGLFVDTVNREDRERFWTAVRTVSAEAYARRLQLIADLDLESRLGEIQSPTLFIAGSRDLLISSVKEAHSMAARMPAARVRVIEGAGHACLMGSRVRLDELLAE